MSTVLVGTFTLGAVNVGLTGAIAAVVPLLAQVDLMLTGSFGLGSLLADLAVQLNAALAAQAQILISVTDPIAALKAQLQAILSVQAGISATLALGLPPFAISVSASAALSASLALKVGGIQALIRLVLSIKLPLVSLVGQLNAALSAGPFVLLSVGFDAPSTLASSTTEYSALVGSGVGGILPGDQVYGVILLTKAPSAAASLSVILKTS